MVAVSENRISANFGSLTETGTPETSEILYLEFSVLSLTGIFERQVRYVVNYAKTNVIERTLQEEKKTTRLQRNV